MIEDSLWGSIGVIVGPIIGLLGVLYGHFAKRRSDKEQVAAHLVASHHNFKVENKKLDLDALNLMVTAMQTELKRVNERVDHLQEKVDALMTKYWKAIHYIRTLLLRIHENKIEVPEPPAEIKNDI